MMMMMTGLILVPNGKLIGKSLGDRYPGEEALERAKAAAEAAGEVWSERQWRGRAQGEEERGPGGRLYGVGQEDEETRLLRRPWERRVSTQTDKRTKRTAYYYKQRPLQPVGLSGDNSSLADDGNGGGLASDLGLPISEKHQSHPWGVFFTVLGTVLLDFDADACQSPSRAYLLDVTLPGEKVGQGSNYYITHETILFLPKLWGFFDENGIKYV